MSVQEAALVVLFAAGAFTPAAVGFLGRPRSRKPMCAHCQKRIRDGAVLTISRPGVAGDVIIEATWHLDRPDCRAASTRWDRTAVYPNGDAPEGCCNICGMHDPEHLVDGCHDECAEWLGERVESLRERRLRAGVATPSETRASLRKAACAHEHTEDVYTYGGRFWRLCLVCGADVGAVAPDWTNFTARGIR